GANPSRHLPLGSLLQRRGDQLADATRGVFDRPGVTLVDNWTDTELADSRYWSPDKLHLNTLGHTRVACRVLEALGVPVPVEWGAGGAAGAPAHERVEEGVGANAAYYRRYVLPWIGRRITGRSSGDGRPPKRPAMSPLDLT
ncbi:MAG: family lipase, partial [Cryobacterium sp.]|nr:family lipase [Cryobacterium sp.]